MLDLTNIHLANRVGFNSFCFCCIFVLVYFVFACRFEQQKTDLITFARLCSCLLVIWLLCLR